MTGTDPDLWQRVRAAYEGGAEDVKVLCERHGISEARLYAEAKRQGWRLRRRQRGKAGRGDPFARMRALIERRIAEVEKRAAEPLTAAEQEREARAVASLLKALQTLIGLEARRARSGRTKAKRTAGERDALRGEIAQRLERMLAVGPAG